MNTRLGCFATVFLTSAVAVSAQTLPSGFADAVAKTGNPYRAAVALVTNNADAAKHLQGLLAQEPADSVNARCARILLARIDHPEVFIEFTNEIQKSRNSHSSSHGENRDFLAGVLMQFIRRGPENRVIEMPVGWESLPVGSGNQSNVIMRQRKYEKVEKYSAAEVQAGIARNAAARQAVLEHFLKFLDEGSAYEQSQMVELVGRLWGRSRSKRAGDLAIIDHVQDADGLTEAIFRDASRPTLARMRASFSLADVKQTEVQAFMLSVVTNTPTDERGQENEDMAHRALAYLEYSADANALAVLKRQTNGPAWKRETIEKTNQAIEGRLSVPAKDK